MTTTAVHNTGKYNNPVNYYMPHKKWLPSWLVPVDPGRRVFWDCATSAALWQRSLRDLWGPGVPAHDDPSAETAPTAEPTSLLRPPSVARSPTPACLEPTSASGLSYVTHRHTSIEKCKQWLNLAGMPFRHLSLAFHQINKASLKSAS